MRPLAGFALFVAILLPSRAIFAQDDGPVRVDVVIDMMEAGKKLPRPTAEKPTYYQPLWPGYKELGDIETNYQKAPPRKKDVENLLINALAAQHYLRTTGQSPPTIAIMFWWGYAAPRFWQPHVGEPLNSGTLMNVDEMTAIVCGDHLISEEGSEMAGELQDAARVSRWYVRVAAIDYKDWYYRHKITGLWRVHMSTGLWGYYLDEILPTLVAAGAPYFGRGDAAPRFIRTPVIPEGRVIVGTPSVKSSGPASATPAP